MKNVLALLFVILTQAACAAFYSFDIPASYGDSNFRCYWRDLNDYHKECN